MDGMMTLDAIGDTLVNLMSGLGAMKDKGAQGRFMRSARLTRFECDALYHQNWLGGKLIDAVADDMTSEWRQWEASKAVVDAITETEERLDLRGKVAEVLKLSAKDGGAGLLIGTNEDPLMPFDPNRVGRDGLLWLHVVTRWDLSVGDLIRDPMSPYFKQPSEYRMALPDGSWIRIHPSRILLFITTDPGEPLLTGEPWGYSIYDRLHNPIRDVTAALQGVASLMQEAKIDVVKVPGLTKGVVNERFREAVLQRFGIANTIKSINSALLLDKDEEWDQKTLTFSGFPEIIDRLLLIVAGARDMPLTRLVGRSPAGLNATGESDSENYYKMLRSRQNTMLRPILRPLDTALIRSSTGRNPRGVTYDWRSLWSMSDTDKADVRVKHSQAVKNYADAGIFDHTTLAKAAGTSLEEDSFLMGVQPAAKSKLEAEADAKIRVAAEAPKPTPPAAPRPRRAPAAG